MVKSKQKLTSQEELERWRDGLGQSLKRRQKSSKRSVGNRILRGLATTLALTGILGAITITWFYKDLEDRFSRVDVNVAAVAGGVLNILVLGSDSRADLNDPGDETRFGTGGGRRADTIMLVQVNPSEGRASILGFPRDLWVRVANKRSPAKINSAYNDGPQAMIDTVQGLTGVPINHYMELDFGGFQRVVDAIGGINICLEEKFYDSGLNFRLPAGKSTLNGANALSYVRSRKATANGDFGRIERQQVFLKAVVQKIGTPRTLANPVRVRELGVAFADNVTVDPSFNLSDIIKLAVDVRSVGVDQITSFSVPGRIGAAGRQSVVLVNQNDAELLFAAFRENRDPADAFKPKVVVLDASGRAILDSVATELSAKGFLVVRQQSVAPTPQTIVSAPRSLNNDASKLADTIVTKRATNSGEELVLTIGQDWQGFVPGGPGAPAVGRPPGLCG